MVARRKVGVIIKEHEGFCDDGTVMYLGCVVDIQSYTCDKLA